MNPPPSNPWAVYDVTKARLLLPSVATLLPKWSQRTYPKRVVSCWTCVDHALDIFSSRSSRGVSFWQFHLIQHSSGNSRQCLLSDRHGYRDIGWAECMNDSARSIPPPRLFPIRSTFSSKVLMTLFSSILFGLHVNVRLFATSADRFYAHLNFTIVFW